MRHTADESLLATMSGAHGTINTAIWL